MRTKTVLSFLLVVSSALGAPLPSARELLESVRMHQAQQDLELKGQLRDGATGKINPFRLIQTGPVIRYSFSNPDEALQLRLGENESRLELITSEGAEKVTTAQVDHKVRGTGVTYEDLAMKFLYWTDAKVTGENSIRTRNCWKVELKAPSRQSQYSNIWLWIDKNGGAIMRIDGFDWSAKLSKRFEVVSAQKIDDRWFLKEMRIEEFDPGTGKVKTRTYLEIKK